MTSCSGIIFNNRFKNIKFVKLFFDKYDYYDESGYKREYKDGLNCDNFENYNILWGRFLFTDLDNFHKLLSLKNYKYVSEIIIPDDALVYYINDGDGYYFSTDKFILIERFLIKDLGIWEDEEFCKKIVFKVPETFKYTKKQSLEMCKFAVSKYGKSLKYVKNKTKEICDIAVKCFPYSSKYINKN